MRDVANTAGKLSPGSSDMALARSERATFRVAVAVAPIGIVVVGITQFAHAQSEIIKSVKKVKGLNFRYAILSGTTSVPPIYMLYASGPGRHLEGGVGKA